MCVTGIPITFNVSRQFYLRVCVCFSSGNTVCIHIHLSHPKNVSGFCMALSLGTPHTCVRVEEQRQSLKKT
jgi:hypothetical protein